MARASISSRRRTLFVHSVATGISTDGSQMPYVSGHHMGMDCVFLPPIRLAEPCWRPVPQIDSFNINRVIPNTNLSGISHTAMTVGFNEEGRVTLRAKRCQIAVGWIPARVVRSGQAKKAGRRCKCSYRRALSSLGQDQNRTILGRALARACRCVYR
jgi:hypothetical protein